MLADVRKDHCIPLIFYKNLIGDQLWKHLVDQIHQPQGPHRQFSSGTAKKSGQDKLGVSVHCSVIYHASAQYQIYSGVLKN